MCGVVGLIRLDGAAADRGLIAEMQTRIAHRGPDGSGTWVDGPVGLGHVRLSIIDIEGSQQPMAGAGGTVHLTFNGEILNYQELRTSLDYPFRTAGDTEVLLAHHMRHGTAGIPALRGQFAYGVYDSGTGDLHLVRDRMGILPMYYYQDSTVFAFASEPKALLPVIPGGGQVDTDSLHDYLAHRSVPAPFTLIAGIRKLPAAHHLRLTRDGRVDVRRYWAPAQRPAEPAGRPADAVAAVGSALENAVDEALVADVPVGTYLSGGLDSSLITAFAARSRGIGAPLHTYAAGFGDARMDELPWARRVSELLATQHHEVHVAAEDFIELWPALSWHRDGPLSEPADIAVHRLATRASEDVKVVLSGEGSDELFGGYPKHRMAGATRWAGVLPAAVRGAVLGTAERNLPARAAKLAIALRMGAEASAEERMRSWFAPFGTTERAGLLGGPPSRDSLGPYRGSRGDALHRMLYADVHTWLSDNLLERGDRMTMAAGMELRPPFLDARVVDLAFSLPSSVKVRGGVTKWVVKEVARRFLPDEVVSRRKVGFRVPLDAWFRGGLEEMAFDLLTDPSSFASEVLDRAAVRNLLDAHRSGGRDFQARIWTLLALEVWHREFRRHRVLRLAA